MQFNAYFSYEEMTTTDSSAFLSANREQGEQYKDELQALVLEILTPIREYYGKPVKIHSAFRHEALNKHIGGAATSQHRFGEAADFHISTLFALGFLLFVITFVVRALAKVMILRAEKARGA